MGGKAYGLLKSLTAPEKPLSLSYNQIVKTLADHLAPKPPVIAERFRFHQRSQGPDETISAYVAGLRQLTQHCEFGIYLDEALRDRLVCGIPSSHIQRRLLSEDKLTFKRALEVALAMETAAKDTKFMTEQSMPAAVLGQSEEVHKATNQRTIKQDSRSQELLEIPPIWLHLAHIAHLNVIKAYGKMGHLATICRSRLIKRVTVDSSFQAKHVGEDQEEWVVEEDVKVLTVSHARAPPL